MPFIVTLASCINFLESHQTCALVFLRRYPTRHWVSFPLWPHVLPFMNLDIKRSRVHFPIWPIGVYPFPLLTFPFVEVHTPQPLYPSSPVSLSAHRGLATVVFVDSAIVISSSIKVSRNSLDFPQNPSPLSFSLAKLLCLLQLLITRRLPRLLSAILLFFVLFHLKRSLVLWWSLHPLLGINLLIAPITFKTLWLSSIIIWDTTKRIMGALPQTSLVLSSGANLQFVFVLLFYLIFLSLIFFIVISSSQFRGFVQGRKSSIYPLRPLSSLRRYLP